MLTPTLVLAVCCCSWADDIHIIHRIDEKVIWKLVYKETYQQLYVGRPVRILSFIHSGIFDIFFYNLFWLFFDVFVPVFWVIVFLLSTPAYKR